MRSGPAIFLYKEEKGQKGRTHQSLGGRLFLFDGVGKMRGWGMGERKNSKRGRGRAKGQNLSKWRR